MKKLLITSLIINILLTILLIQIYNNPISWEHNGKLYTHKAGDFFIERLRGE